MSGDVPNHIEAIQEAYHVGRRIGIREVVEWVEKYIPKTLANYVGFWCQWRSKKKEWGL